MQSPSVEKGHAESALRETHVVPPTLAHMYIYVVFYQLQCSCAVSISCKKDTSFLPPEYNYIARGQFQWPHCLNSATMTLPRNAVNRTLYFRVEMELTKPWLECTDKYHPSLAMVLLEGYYRGEGAAHIYP